MRLSLQPFIGTSDKFEFYINASYVVYTIFLNNYKHNKLENVYEWR